MNLVLSIGPVFAVVERGTNFSNQSSCAGPCAGAAVDVVAGAAVDVVAGAAVDVVAAPEDAPDDALPPPPVFP